jgi:integrase
MPIHKLTTANISKPGLHSDGGGLYLQVTIGVRGTVRRSWVFRYQRAGRVRDAGLGSQNTFSLAEARQRARSYRQLLADGIDPLEYFAGERARKAAEIVRRMTFDQCAEAYQKQHRAAWSPIHARQWRTTIARYVSPFIGALPVSEVASPHVNRILDAIWAEKPETANRVRARIEAVLDWAVVSGFRAAGDNPARWKGYLSKKFKAPAKLRPVRHQTALPYVGMPAFMADLRARGGAAALALEFTILTGVRSCDVLRARRADIDRAAKLWIIPQFSKTAKEHRVPLSDAAIVCIERAAEIAGRPSEFVFCNELTGKRLSDKVMLDVIDRLGRKADLTPHGCRSTFRSWAAEQTNFPHEVCELALGHTIPAAVVRAYQRGDLLAKRALLMQHWADYLAAPAAAVADDTVVAIRTARQ